MIINKNYYDQNNIKHILALFHITSIVHKKKKNISAKILIETFQYNYNNNVL